MKHLPIFIISCLVCLSACTKEGANNAGQGSISGFAQKGQFVKGSQVTAFALGNNLVATGESFPANISDDLGSFSISGNTSAPYVELRAEGYYFNEITGKVSTSPLYLEAIVNSGESKANINLLTTAIKLRVKKLIKDGKSFAESKQQAQNELASAFGKSGFSDFEKMDISGNSTSDAALLAFACLVQNGREASGVTTLIQEIASELESEGKLKDATIGKVKTQASEVDVFAVYLNLAQFYAEKEIQGATVPAFHKFYGEKYEKPFIVLEDKGSDPIVIVVGPGDGTKAGADESLAQWKVLSDIDFDVTSNSESVKVTKKHITGPAYLVSASGSAASSWKIEFKDSEGNILFSELNETPGSVISEDTFFQDETNITAAIYGVYNHLARFIELQGNLEELALSGIVAKEKITPSCDAISNVWSAGYMVIRDVNTIISHSGNCPFDAGKYVAQAMAVRGFVYYNMAMLWGDVPLITEPVTVGDAFFPRTPKADVYGFAVNQLMTSLDKIDGFAGQTQNANLFLNSDAVNLLMAELMLTIGEGQTAEKFASESRIFQTESVFTAAYSNGVDVTYQLVLMPSHFALLKEEASGKSTPEDILLHWKQQGGSHLFGYWAMLKRLGLAMSETGSKEYQLLMPIPAAEIMYNPSMSQNPGY